MCLGGRVEAVHSPLHCSHRSLRLTPAQVRARMVADGWTARHGRHRPTGQCTAPEGALMRLEFQERNARLLMLAVALNEDSEPRGTGSRQWMSRLLQSLRVALELVYLHFPRLPAHRSSSRCAIITAKLPYSLTIHMNRRTRGHTTRLRSGQTCARCSGTFMRIDTRGSQTRFDLPCSESRSTISSLSSISGLHTPGAAPRRMSTSCRRNPPSSNSPSIP